MAITKATTYTCSDGTQFTDEFKANDHEQKLDDLKFSEIHGCGERASKWLRTSWSGKRLLEKHSLNEEGIWRIRGEDPNCDMGGNHHQPDLGTVEGVLRDVVEYAVKQSGFYTWGSGGNIDKIKVKSIKKV